MMLGDLPPSSSVTRLSARPGLGADLAPDGGRAGEGDLVDLGVLDERGAGRAVAGEDVQHTRWQPGLQRELAQAQRGERRLLGRLQHDRAAGRERRRDLPGGHHQREVPRDDLRAHADGLAAGVAVHVGRGHRQHRALDLGRPAREVAQVRDRAGDVDVAREVDRLAVVERLDLGELLRVVFDGLREGEHDPLATARGHARPGTVGERGARGGQRAGDVRGAGVRDLRDLPPGRRVERRERTAVGGRGALRADQQAVRDRR